MESNVQEEREVRAARNQALFRAVNEKLEAMNEAFVQFNERFTIACECSEVTIYPEVEVVVRERRVAWW
jgi:hypothetical protein